MSAVAVFSEADLQHRAASEVLDILNIYKDNTPIKQWDPQYLTLLQNIYFQKAEPEKRLCKIKYMDIPLLSRLRS
jgi:hypothetical protein